MNRLTWSGLACLAVVSCVPTYKTIVTQEYESRKIKDVTLAIAPLNNVVVDYQGSVKDEFGDGDEQDLIIQHFKQTLVSKLRKESGFSSIAFDDYADAPKMANRHFDLNDAFSLELALPADSSAIRFASSTPDFILFLQDLSLGVEGLQDKGWEEAGRKYLRYKCGFAFWDNRLHRLAAYGRIFAASYAEGYGYHDKVQIVTIENWNAVDRYFVYSLIGNTPFEK